MLRRRSPEKGPTRLHDIGTREIEILVDQEIFLFRAERDARKMMIVILAEAFEKTLHRSRKHLDGFEKRRFLIQRSSGIGTECGRDAECGSVRMAFDECGA